MIKNTHPIPTTIRGSHAGNHSVGGDPGFLDLEG